MNLFCVFHIFCSVRRFCSSCFVVALWLFVSQHSWAECPPRTAVGNVDFGATPIVVNPKDPIGTVIKRYPVGLSDVDSICKQKIVGGDSLLMVAASGPEGSSYCNILGVKGLGLRLRILNDRQSVQYGDVGPNGAPAGGLPGTSEYVLCRHQTTNDCMMPGPPCLPRDVIYGVRTRGAQFEVELIKTSMEPVSGTLNIPFVLTVSENSAELIKISGSGAPPVVTKRRTCTVAPGGQGKVWPMGPIDVREIPTGISKVVAFPISLTCDAGATMKLQATGVSPGQPVVLPNKQEAGYATGVGVALSYQGKAINFGEDIPIPVALNDGPVDVSLGANYQLLGGPVTPGPFFASATFTIIEK